MGIPSGFQDQLLWEYRYYTGLWEDYGLWVPAGNYGRLRAAGDVRTYQYELFRSRGSQALFLCGELQGKFGQGQDGMAQRHPLLSSFRMDGPPPPHSPWERLFDFQVLGSVRQAVMIEFFKIKSQITSSVKSGNIQEVHWNVIIIGIS